MPDIAVVNGAFMPLADAKVSVEDRGFQFGDGVYELIRCYAGQPYKLDEHLRRLERSARAVELPSLMARDRWRALITEAVQQSGYPEARVYIQVTRGTAPRTHTFPELPQPTTVITVRAIEPIPAVLREAGVSVILVPDLRWGRCHIKSINLLPNVLAREQAKQRGAWEALFVREGTVMEGAGSNVFAVIRGTVVTPPEGPALLSGITREVILDLARAAGLDVAERPLLVEALRGAEEVFLTATSFEVMPVTAADGAPIGSGKPGEVTLALHRQFRAITPEAVR